MSLSFEDGDVGGRSPPSPWYMIGTAATHEISDAYASDGSKSMHIASYQSSLDRTEFAVDVDLTQVSTVLYDGYVESNNPNWGDIKVNVDDTTVSNQLVSGDSPENRWYSDVSVDVSGFSGTHTLAFWVRGNGNDAYFDNIRFVDSDGNSVSPSEVIAGSRYNLP